MSGLCSCGRVFAPRRDLLSSRAQVVRARHPCIAGSTELVRTCRKAGLRVAVASSADRVKVCLTAISALDSFRLRALEGPLQIQYSWDGLICDVLVRGTCGIRAIQL